MADEDKTEGETVNVEETVKVEEQPLLVENPTDLTRKGEYHFPMPS